MATKPKRRAWGIRVDDSTPATIEAIAAKLECWRVDPQTRQLIGAAGVLMDRIAAGEFKIVPDDAWVETKQMTN